MPDGTGSGLLPQVPDFPLFYRAINNRDPFPWQSRLAREVAQTEKWPEEIGVPTGLGKTACLDIAVWWLASQAHLPPKERRAPTRIWWIVNRRLLVDATFDHAVRLRSRLVEVLEDGEARSGPLEEAVFSVAKRLCSLAAQEDGDPLEIIRLRGGVARTRPTDPSQPAVILSTIPMYGSALLFRGYGATQSMRPIDAAHAGADSLVLLDEAHLAPHLSKLLKDLDECAPAAMSVLAAPRHRPQLVSLTATGTSAGSGRFDLDGDDRAHPEVLRRLWAAKPMEVRCFKRGDVAKLLAEATEELIGGLNSCAAILVFANTPATARAAFDRLKKTRTRKCEADLLLLTGRMREVEAQSIRERVLDSKSGMPVSRDLSITRDRHLVVVATQTLEVGADLDAEYLITEACGVRALTQRLGRLNRLGRFPNARAIYLHVPPPPAKGQPAGWPVYGSEPDAVHKRLKAAEGSGERVADMSPATISGLLGPPSGDNGRAPEVLYGLLWEWLKTTSPPIGEAPVEPYFSGIANPSRTVSFIWRLHVPPPGNRLWPRPREVEAVEVPIVQVQEVLKNDELHRIASDGATIEPCTASELRPGNQVVLPSVRGLLDEFGWNSQSDEPVIDVSLDDNGLPLDADALKLLCGIDVKREIDEVLGNVDDDDGIGEPKRRQAFETIRNRLSAASPLKGWTDTSWQEFIDALDDEVRTPAKEVPRLVRTHVSKGETEPLDEFDERSLAVEVIELDAHGTSVGHLARKVASRLGIAGELADVLERAGNLHDIGKADRRFQHWLDPGGRRPETLLAKSDSPRDRWERDRITAGWPKGGRHEALSARLVDDWLDSNVAWRGMALGKLLMHLVVSHHGKGRPLIAPVRDSTETTVTREISGKRFEVSANLSEVDWNQPARFAELNKEYGPWGLALLETILRQADHAVSSGRR